ncbi:MAG: ribonuclease PH [Clostridiales bacterium]|nr:ribonuclease PH [Clostridiales bacterium]
MDAVSMRPVRLTMDFLKNAHSSCLVEFGNTRVIVSAMAEEGVPEFRMEKGGWITAEYAMLPASTPRRKQRDGAKKDGRGVEISRLIGRSLRSGFELSEIPGYTIRVDCDVLDADGGTRTASITGAFCAVYDLLRKLTEQGKLPKMPGCKNIAAISVGMVDGEYMLDLCYREDSNAEVDMNVVMSGDGGIIEIQGTGEKHPFTYEQMQDMLALAKDGIFQLFDLQNEVLMKGE